MQYLAREGILQRQATGDTAPRAAGTEGEIAPPALGELIIPLWPLLAACVVLLLLSTTMLIRSRLAAISNDRGPPHVGELP